MSTPPRQPPPEPPSFLPKPQRERPSVMKTFLMVLGVLGAIAALVLLVGVGLIWAVCTATPR